MKHAMMRYEAEYLASARGVNAAVTEHTEIAEALRAHDIERAASRLVSHWHRGMEAVLRGRQAEVNACCSQVSPGVRKGGLSMKYILMNNWSNL